MEKKDKVTKEQAQYILSLHTLVAPSASIPRPPFNSSFKPFLFDHSSGAHTQVEPKSLPNIHTQPFSPLPSTTVRDASHSHGIQLYMSHMFISHSELDVISSDV
jgi:hypothetical protein